MLRAGRIPNVEFRFADGVLRELELGANEDPENPEKPGIDLDLDPENSELGASWDAENPESDPEYTEKPGKTRRVVRDSQKKCSRSVRPWQAATVSAFFSPGNTR